MKLVGAIKDCGAWNENDLNFMKFWQFLIKTILGNYDFFRIFTRLGFFEKMNLSFENNTRGYAFQMRSSLSLSKMIQKISKFV